MMATVQHSTKKIYHVGDDHRRPNNTLSDQLASLCTIVREYAKINTTPTTALDIVDKPVRRRDTLASNVCQTLHNTIGGGRKL